MFRVLPVTRRFIFQRTFSQLRPIVRSPFRSFFSSPVAMAHLQQGDPKQQYDQPPFRGARELDAPGSDKDMNPRPHWGERTYRGSDKLKDGVALITGGDSGIGRAVAIAFAREGCDIAISYLPQEQEDAEQTKKWVEESGKKCLLLPGDLTDPEYCKKIVEDTVNKFEKITILVNNAATQGKSKENHIQEMSYDRVLTTFRTNIVSFFETSKYAIKHMKPGSAIINTGSIQAYDPSAPILDYACTKAAIVAFTKGLCSELIDKGIRVNCVAPGPVWTPLVAASFPQEKVQEFGKSKPYKRPAQPAELAPAYVFLASNETGSYVNGEVLAVTGGLITA